MPSLIQTAFAVEALFNVFGGVSLCVFPTAVLSRFLASPLPSLELNATSILLARSLGLLILALTPQLLFAYPNNKDCVGKRRTVYLTLGAGEMGLVPLLLWEAFRASDESKAAGVWAGGLSRNAALISAANLVPILAWRIYVFQFKPHWFGDTEDVVGKSKRSK